MAVIHTSVAFKRLSLNKAIEKVSVAGKAKGEARWGKEGRRGPGTEPWAVASFSLGLEGKDSKDKEEKKKEEKLARQKGHLWQELPRIQGKVFQGKCVSKAAAKLNGPKTTNSSLVVKGDLVRSSFGGAVQRTLMSVCVRKTER